MNNIENLSSIHSNKFNNIQIFLSAISHFITDIYQNFIIGLIPLITLKFGLSLFKVALLTSTSVIANSLFSPIFGYFSDKKGLKYFLITGPLVTSVFLSLIGVIPNYYILLIFLFFGNLGVAAYHPASAAIAGHFGGKNKGMGSSIINFGGNFGSACGVLLIISIAEKININFTPFAMIPGIIIVAVLLKYAPTINNKTNFKSNSNNSINIKNTYSNTYNNTYNNNYFNNNSNKIIKNEENLFVKLKNIKKQKIPLLCLIMLSIYSLYIIWTTMSTYMPLYFTNKGFSQIITGFILFLFITFGASGGIVSGFIFDRFKKGNYIIQICLLLSIPLFYFAFRTQQIILTIVLFILGGFFIISIQPVCIRITQDLLPKNMSFASSLILGLSPGFAGITMIFLGKAADKIGIIRLINFELAFAFIVFLILFFYPYFEKKWEKLT